MLSIVLVLGIGTAIPSMALAFQEGLWALIAVDLVAIGWLVAIWRLRGWSYRTRVFNFIAIVFLVSTGMIVNVGQVAQIYLVAPPVFAAILLGRRPALAALGLAALLVFGLSLAGHVRAELGALPTRALVPSLMVALNFLFIGALITVSCSTLLQKLATSFGELHAVAESMEESRDAIHRLAYYDVLTELPNRRYLLERLDLLLAEARAATGTAQGADWGAVIFIDLDHFKYVNDARGHATGDALLRSVAARLSHLMRDGDTVARIGGDEFVVLLPRIGHDHDSAATAALAGANRLRHALLDAVEVDGNRYKASASLGVTLLSPGGQSAHDLLREADTAMYQAKARGRNGVALFEATMRAEVEQRLTLERDLAGAIDRGELALYLQLQCDTAGVPVGAEMLMRWQRADGSFVPPDVFIPIAEASGLIVPLGQWALHQTCLAWRRLDAAGHRMPLSVNVSPLQFGQADFVEQVHGVLARTGVPADGLILELTEGLLIQDREGTIARMHALAATGIRFSIDDFGTGYSNLGYLKRMPLYELKIDKSFVRDTPDGADGDAIVCSILAMAAHLRLRVVAEGVETREQADFLAANGCPSMQGYLFARPQPLAQVLAGLDVPLALAA
nr:bifunctional diguanylate cyclase/phosphodiesterase [Massilia sp. CFBP 13721]